MSGVFGEGRHFTAHIPERVGDASITVDDVDITAAVGGFHVHGWDGDPGTTVTVTLNLPMVPTTDLDARRASVVLSAECTQLLIDAGWVPPEVADQLHDVVGHARAWRDRRATAMDLNEALDRYEGGSDAR